MCLSTDGRKVQLYENQTEDLTFSQSCHYLTLGNARAKESYHRLTATHNVYMFFLKYTEFTSKNVIVKIVEPCYVIRSSIVIICN